LPKGSGAITVLAGFNNNAEGNGPYAGVIMDASGNLYGTTKSGGANGYGVVYEVAQGTGTVTDLAMFNGANGAGPGVGSLLMDSSGNLYGTTTAGGAYGDGTVFEVAKGSGSITTLAPFNGTNGSTPRDGLIMDGSGNLYGTTLSGGAYNDGTVFELQRGTMYIFSGFSSTTPGVAGQFTVMVQNPDGSTDTGYTGTIHFTSSDPMAVLPADYTFTPTDAGVHAFSATIYHSGTITGTDTANDHIVAQMGIEVAGPPTGFVLSGYPSPTLTGTSNSFTVTATDQYGNVVTGYTGTVSFTSSDPQASLPANYTFTTGIVGGNPGDNGVRTFSATLKTAGSQSITATDTSNSSWTGTQSGITVTPGAATHLSINAPSSVRKGVAFNATVTALDAYGNVATGYTGTVQFTSSDRQAKLPANYTFAAADNGVHTFSVTLNTTGTQSLTVKDTAKKSTITGTDPSIVVGAALSQPLLQGNLPAHAASGHTSALLHDEELWQELIASLLETDPSKRLLGIM
jgi:uncharacterized repeat protein (TIGR03803 family)